MLRPSQHLCRQGITRSIDKFWTCEITPSCRGNATIIARTRLSGDSLTRISGPRHFTTSQSRLFEPTKPTVPEQSTAIPPSTTTETNTGDGIPPPSPKRPKRRRLLYAVVLILFGAGIGTGARITLIPPDLPPPGSEQDIYLHNKIQAQGNALPIIKELSADPAWTSWDAYSGVTAARTRITSGPMSGFAGLAFQRIFHNAATGEVVTVVYFGAGLAGFPGIVHGGALATLLDESLGRCAILRFPSRTGVTANLELKYRAPTLTNRFYVIRARPVASHDDDVVGKDGVRKGDRKLWVKGTLEVVDGKVAVEANGLFVVPRGYTLRPLVEGF
ncbi:hypothetical protein F5Y08DRAFT_272670 [Xylaria arbuscula]|nr:hypothetical protein F5Y08DRAFT_272670 [Xylaria arbuscula]